jgi:ribosomal protein S18 acetylase RimI-like enzyme
VGAAGCWRWLDQQYGVNEDERHREPIFYCLQSGGEETHLGGGWMSISVRRWTWADLPTIQRLLLETWVDAYGSFIPREDLAGYLQTQYSQAKLEALFEDQDVTGLVAEVDGAVAGYEKMYHARAEQRFYVHQLYILPARQGLGLGHRLMACAEERARELGAGRIWLGVMVKNTQAVTWYKKMGLVVTETAPFVMGSTTVDHYIGYLPLPLARSSAVPKVASGPA